MPHEYPEMLLSSDQEDRGSDNAHRGECDGGGRVCGHAVPRTECVRRSVSDDREPDDGADYARRPVQQQVLAWGGVHSNDCREV